tara:strand:+ start:1527 stop:3467 length:1941 start_codon:yes stop_codon:yes gene_type:complete
MNVLDRKLFNRGARDELRRKGGIMASSEPMMQAVGYENGGGITGIPNISLTNPNAVRFVPTNDQIAPPPAVSQIPVQGRTNVGPRSGGFSAAGALRARQLREPFGVQPPFRTDAIAQATAQSQRINPPSYLYVNIPGVTPDPVLMTEQDFERFEKMYPDAAQSSDSTVIDVASLDSRVDISNVPIVTSLDPTSGSRKDAVEKTKKTTTPNVNVNTPSYNPATTVIDYDPTNVDQAALQLRAEQKANQELYTDRLRIENQIKRLEESAITIDDFERLKVLKAQLESMGGSTDQNPVTAQLKQAEANFGKLIKQDQDTAQISSTARDLVVAQETVNQLEETLKLANPENKPVIQNRLENANDALVVAKAAHNNAKLEQTSEFPIDERLAPQANKRRDDDPDLSELVTSTPKAPEKPKFPSLDQFIEVQGGRDEREKFQTNADKTLDDATKDFGGAKTDDAFDDVFDKYVSRFSEILGDDEEEKKRNTGFALAMYGATYAATGDAGQAAMNMIETLRGDAATRQERKDKIKMLALQAATDKEARDDALQTQLAKETRQDKRELEKYEAKLKIKEKFDDPTGYLDTDAGKFFSEIYADVLTDDTLNEDEKGEAFIKRAGEANAEAFYRALNIPRLGVKQGGGKGSDWFNQ